MRSLEPAGSLDSFSRVARLRLAASIQGTARAARLPGQRRRGANSTRHNRENIQERCVSKMTHRRTKPRTDGGISSPSVVAAASRRGDRMIQPTSVFCEGFRMPAGDGGGGELSGLRAGVRKPPKEEI